MTLSTMLKYFAGMAMIGDGVVALVNPKADARAWNCGPRPWRCLMSAMEEHPTLTRAAAALEIAGGICLAMEALGAEKPIDA